MPREVDELIINFAKKFKETIDTTVDKSTEMRLTTAYLIIVNRIRKLIGTDPLIKETIGIIERYLVTRRKNQ